MDPLLLANPQLSSLINLSNTYPPYHSKCPFPISSSFMLPFSHWSLFFFITLLLHLHCYRIESLSSLFTITTMIKTLNPYPNPAKTAEIMSRYRPIAPKPDTCSTNSITDGSSSSNSLSQKIKQSPYLRNLWPQLQARPTRTRKRGRASLALPSSLKRQKTHQVLGFCPPCHLTSSSLSSSKTLSLQGFAPPPSLSLPHPQLPLPKTPITLPLLPGAITNIPPNTNPREEVITDLNLSSTTNAAEIPQERDLLQQLQKPASNNNINVNVIAPQPIRPIGSSISVGCINEDTTLLPTLVESETTKRSPEELEEEVESETLPAVISDSNNRVRMANSAYKEMVGQPECTWLSGIGNGNGNGDGRVLSKRIGGEVRLHLCDSKSIPVSSKGFSCWVKIEWESEEKKKSSVNAFCDVMKLCCESRDYLFTWRFHTRDCREASQSSGNAV